MLLCLCFITVLALNVWLGVLLVCWYDTATISLSLSPSLSLSRSLSISLPLSRLSLSLFLSSSLSLSLSLFIYLSLPRTPLPFSLPLHPLSYPLSLSPLGLGLSHCLFPTPSILPSLLSRLPSTSNHFALIHYPTSNYYQSLYYAWSICNAHSNRMKKKNFRAVTKRPRNNTPGQTIIAHCIHNIEMIFIFLGTYILLHACQPLDPVAPVR